MTRRRAAYARAGVDVAAGDRAVELMRAAVAIAPGGRRSSAGSAASAARSRSRPGYREPVLVSSTDGVGTKTAIAAALGRLRHDRPRPRRDVRRRRRVHGRRAARSSSTTSRSGGWTRSRSRSSSSGIADGCRRGGLRAGRRRDGRAPGPHGARRVRPRRVLRRGRGARTLLDGTAARAGDAIVGLASSRAACERLLAGARAGARPSTSTSTRRTRGSRCRALGCAAVRVRADRRAGARAMRPWATFC